MASGRTGVELYSAITERFSLPLLDVPDLSGIDPRPAAQRLRAEWKLGSDPLPNSVQLAESRGVRVLSLPDGPADVDAFSLWEGDRPYVFLSTMKTPERSRFDLAHELGHLVMHAGLSSADENERDAEREADQFAAEFLMPRAALQASVRREPSIDAILRSKGRWGVSAMALVYSCHKAGLLSDWSYRRSCTELAKRGYRTGEPEGMQRETSRVFRSTLPALQSPSNRGSTSLTGRLGVSLDEIHGLTFGQALAGVTETVGATRDPVDKRPRGHLSLVR